MKPDWMSEDDPTILRFLKDHQSPTTAEIIAYHLDITHGQIKQRLRVLRKHGMVKHPDEVPEGLTARGVYVISEFGIRFVRGDITLSEFREMDPTERDHDDGG